MAIESFDHYKGQKLDLLYKKISGYTKTDTEIAKSASNETIPSPFYVKTEHVISEEIPQSPPTSDTESVKVFHMFNSNANTRLELVEDPTAAPLRSWMAAVNPGTGIGSTDSTPATVIDPLDVDMIRDWIPPTENALYAVNIYISDGVDFTQVFPDGSGNDDQWYFDYQGGVLHFIGENLPSELVSGNTVHIDGYVYTGNKQSDENEYFNEIINKLIPPPPADFPSEDLVIVSVGDNPFIASGAITDNTNGGSTGTAGDPLVNTPGGIARIAAATFDSILMDYSGPGDTGTLTAFGNGAANGSITFDENDNSGTSGILEVTDNVDHGTVAGYQEGFWYSFRSKLNDASPSHGYNRYSMDHSEAGDTGDVTVLKDNITVAPVVSNGDLTEDTPGTFTYSSSVQHYQNGAMLNLNDVNIQNLVGEAYYGGNPFIVGQGPRLTGAGNIMSSDFTYSYSDIDPSGLSFLTGGIPNRQTLDIDLDPQLITLSGTNAHTTSQIDYRARNVNGVGADVDALTFINFKDGTNNNVVDEFRIIVTLPVPADNAPLQYGERVDSNFNDDTPSYTFTGTSGDFNSVAALGTFEGAVVGGELSHNQVDYTIGYLPVGPDLSVGRSGDQYFTFLVRRKAVSKFDFTFTGKISGLQVKLVDVTDNTSNANGWIDAEVPYLGAGVPGDNIAGGGNGSNGCSLAGSLQPGTVYNNEPVTITFGQASSSSATENNFLIRVKLVDGDYIEKVTIDEATN